jgi:hypothetical protein
MMGVEAHFGTAGPFAAADAHFEGHLATNTELELALRAREVHATSTSQGISELTRRAIDPVFGKMLLQSLGLIIWIISLLPSSKVLARDAIVCIFPLEKKKIIAFRFLARIIDIIAGPD